MSYNPYYMRTPATGQLEPLIPNLGQDVAAGVQSGVQMQSAPYLVQQQQSRAMEMDAMAKQQQLKTLLSFAGPASYGVLTADEKDQPGLYDNFKNQVKAIFPQLANNLPQTWNDQAKSYLTQTYQESQQVKDLMTRNMLSQEMGAHGVDTSHLFPGAQGAAQAGGMGAEGQSPVGPNWTDVLMGAGLGGGAGYELSRLGVEPGIQSTRSQYTLKQLWDPETQQYVQVPAASIVGIPTIKQQTGQVPASGPTVPGTIPTTGAPSSSGVQPTGASAPPPAGVAAIPTGTPVLKKEIGGPEQPFTPDGGRFPVPTISGQNISKLSPLQEHLLEGAADSANKWMQDVNTRAEGAKELGAAYDQMLIGLNGFNPSAATSTKELAQKLMNFVTGGTYTGQLGSLADFNKARATSVRALVRQTSSRAAVQEFGLIGKMVADENFPDKKTAQFVINAQRAATVDMPYYEQQFANKWQQANPQYGLVGAQQKWNEYADPMAIVMMRMPQDQAERIITGLVKTPEGLAMAKNIVRSEKFFDSLGFGNEIRGTSTQGGQ